MTDDFRTTGELVSDIDDALQKLTAIGGGFMNVHEDLGADCNFVNIMYGYGLVIEQIAADLRSICDRLERLPQDETASAE